LLALNADEDPDQRRRMLERSVTDDALLVDPTGHWEGVPDWRSGSAAKRTLITPATSRRFRSRAACRPLLEPRLFEFLRLPCACAPDPLRERLMADAVVGGDRSQRLARRCAVRGWFLGRFLPRHGVEPPPPVRDRDGAVVVHVDVLHLGRDVTALGSHEERSQRLPARFGLVRS
jgi:hypothetical protein